MNLYSTGATEPSSLNTVKSPNCVCSLESDVSDSACDEGFHCVSGPSSTSCPVCAVEGFETVFAGDEDDQQERLRV